MTRLPSLRNLLLVILTCLLTTHDASADVGGPDWLGFNPSVTPMTRDTTLRAVGPGAVMVRPLFILYQRGIAASKGQTCPMSPSCSEYSRLAVRRNGLLKGILMSSDRIHRCGHDLHYYPLVVDGDRFRRLDSTP